MNNNYNLTKNPLDRLMHLVHHVKYKTRLFVILVQCFDMRNCLTSIFFLFLFFCSLQRYALTLLQAEIKDVISNSAIPVLVARWVEYLIKMRSFSCQNLMRIQNVLEAYC